MRAVIIVRTTFAEGKQNENLAAYTACTVKSLQLLAL